MTGETFNKINPIGSGPDTPLANTSWTTDATMNGISAPPKVNPSAAEPNDQELKIGTSEKLSLVTKSFIGATMPQVLASSALLSLIWIAAYLFFLSILCTQALLTFKDYYSHPVTVEVTIETTANFLEFPAVTLCNSNIVKKSYISRIPRYKELASLSDVVYQKVLPEANRDHGYLLNLGLHQCQNSEWIPESWICNNRSDCSGDLSDEIDYHCPDYERLNYSENCLAGYVQCPNELTCAVICDGIKDCVVKPGYDESEESGCASSSGTGELLATTIPAELTSPSYPKNYMNNLQKTYVIKAPEDHVIKITFNYFHVEYEYTECFYDAVEIFDNGTPFTFNGRRKLCGLLCDFGAIVTSSNLLVINFWSDGLVTRPGWSLNYQAIPESELAGVDQNKDVTVSDQCEEGHSSTPAYEYWNNGGWGCTDYLFLCNDYSDYGGWGCTDYLFLCNDYSSDYGGWDCMDENYICDGYWDCSDGEDELNCDNCQTIQCESAWIVGMSLCISEYDMCDGFIDCTNGEDEDVSICGECQTIECQPTWDASITQCIPSYFLCNGFPECLNGEDEGDYCEFYFDQTYEDFWYDFYSQVGAYEFSQFKDIERYDWYSVYNSSEMPDFSDFRNFIKFKQEELVGNGHQKEDFIAQCVFDRQICGIDWFRKFQHVSFGNCYTFNSVVDVQGDMDNVSEPRFTSKTGSENGLALSLFLENEEYLGIIGHYSGVRVVLHNSDEYPPLLTKGIEINSGTATTITIRQETVLRESDPFSDCAEDWPEFLHLNENYRKYRYTLEFCKYLCKQKTLAEECGCTDTFDWNFSDNDYVRERAKQDCDVWNSTEYACLTSVYDDFDKGKRSCDCPNSCFDKFFRALASSASWPSSEYTAHFISLMKTSNSSKIKKFIGNALSEAHDSEEPKTTLHQDIKNNFARVRINFETLVFQKIKESPKYNLSTLFGTIGGNLGLWLGWSILSVMEFVQWVAMAIGLFIMDRRKQRNKNVSQIHNPSPYL